MLGHQHLSTLVGCASDPLGYLEMFLIHLHSLELEVLPYSGIVNLRVLCPTAPELETLRIQQAVMQDNV